MLKRTCSKQITFTTITVFQNRQHNDTLSSRQNSLCHRENTHSLTGYKMTSLQQQQHSTMLFYSPFCHFTLALAPLCEISPVNMYQKSEKKKGCLLSLWLTLLRLCLCPCISRFMSRIGINQPVSFNQPFRENTHG